jgi:hypothetical protein
VCYDCCSAGIRKKNGDHYIPVFISVAFVVVCLLNKKMICMAVFCCFFLLIFECRSCAALFRLDNDRIMHPLFPHSVYTVQQLCPICFAHAPPPKQHIFFYHMLGHLGSVHNAPIKHAIHNYQTTSNTTTLPFVPKFEHAHLSVCIQYRDT